MAPNDRRNDLRGYYHPGNPWRCFGYGVSNALNLVDIVESFYRGDDATPVSNITAANNNIILPYNIMQKETMITLTGAQGTFTQVLPPPAQLRGKYITYVRTDNNPGNTVTIQSWGSAAANPTGTISTVTTPTKITGLSSTTNFVVGQLISGVGIPPNTTLISIEGSTAATMSAAATLTITNGTFNFANAAGYSGTVGQQPAYANYGINGQFTTQLNTQYETVTIGSDGFAYFIQNRRYPSTWLNYGTIAVSGGTVAKGTVVTDRILGKRLGNTMRFRYEYQQSTGGAAGTQPVLLALPSGFTIDVNQISSDATNNGGGTGTVDRIASVAFLGGTGWVADGTTHRGPLWMKVYDSTHLVGLAIVDTTTYNTFPGGASFPNFGAALGFSFEIDVPMLGWGG